MKQFDTQIANRLIYETKPNETIFLAGENGTGKSRLLEHIARNLYQEKHNNIIAIANSSYTRFPSNRNLRQNRYHRYLSGAQRNKPSAIIKSIFSDRNKVYDRKIIYGLVKILSYLGFSHEIGFSLDLKNYSKEIFDPNYQNCDIDYERGRNSEYFTLLDSKINELINKLYFSQGNENIKNSLLFLERHIISNHRIHWIELPNVVSESNMEFILSLLETESELGKDLKINVYCKKKNYPTHFIIDSISSGESSLFSTLQFIQSKIDSYTWILIDEPENSLHPKWQRDYCINILDIFSLYEPKIIIATHSPMIVSGASINNNHYIKSEGKVYTPSSYHPHFITDAEGVESLLMDVFDTLMPKNHNLSSQAQILLDDLSNKKISIIETINKINEWKSKAVEENQLNFLEDLENLAYKLS